MVIYLLRHGKTTASGTYTGSSDVPLSEEGERQVLKNAAFLSKIPFDRCYCSPLMRCKKTFELLGITTECKYDQSLAEIDFGSWEGLSFQEIYAKDEKAFERWSKERENFTFPEGENIAAFTGRVSNWFQQLVTSGAQTVLVVSHGGVIKRAICCLLGFDACQADRFQVNESGVALIKYEKEFSMLAGLNCRG